MSAPTERPASFDFRDETVIVTGGAAGLGRRIAERFAAAGASVVVADHDGDQARQTASELSGAYGKTVPFHVDVTDEAQVGELIEFATGWTGSLSVLVNNAGTSTPGQVIEELDVAAWRRVIDVNLTGPFLTSRAALGVMRRAGYGKIVNIASVAAKRISSNLAASYTASKAGLVAFTRHLAYEAAPFGINVNAVCPGPVDAPMLHRNVSPEALAARVASIPAGRLTTADDQAEAVLFLASASAAMINGVALDVDGGALLGWYDVATYYERRTGSPPGRDS